ncbi:uncharacterized protein LOC122021049 [Zingiber officinale]|uniref:uncharacterized protein LOC122021049 n=1 Tax=Zingiber officinale TaxID=94328 RepID=UPI001C4A93FE|nr:uncharacterized protein LOC122021049 [Zingiber officinale]
MTAYDIEMEALPTALIHYQEVIENLDQDHFWVPASRSRVLSQSRSPTPVRRSRCDRAMPQILEIHFYVTGLPSRVTEKDLEIHFSKEGKVQLTFQIKRAFSPSQTIRWS